MDDLAQELIDQIIDCWEIADKDAMSSCGLVCKLWLPRSRYYLFSSVSVNGKNLHSFVDLVDSSASPILAFIRHLTLEYGIDSLDAAHLARLHPCPNLTSIGIVWGPDNGKWQEDEAALEIHMRSWNDECSGSLSRLVLTDVADASPLIPLCTVTNIISRFPSITTLEINRIHVVDASRTISHPSSPFSQLEDLILVPYEGCTLFFSWLCALHMPPILTSLEISRFIEDGYDLDHEDDDNERQSLPLAAYFQQVGTRLHSLKINLLSAHLFPEFQRRILQYTPNLRNLQFEVFRPSDLLDVVQCLSASHSWDAIEAQIRQDPTDALPWNALDAALAQFRTLTRFNIVLLSNYSRTPEKTSAFTPQTRLLMPLPNARGVLA
ncbi:hypothetical protein FB451DRAFT_1247803 [Mycena latifolia]|nr:hypothetical protein FB451DRAFT_1247803 [Mycena latifolia]